MRYLCETDMMLALGAGVVFTSTFVILKLLKAVLWTWWMVFLPFTTAMCFFVAAVLIIFICEKILKKKPRK